MEAKHFVHVFEEASHVKVVSLDQRLESVIADIDLSKILEVRFGSPLIFVENVYWADQHKPVILTQNYYRGDKCSYSRPPNSMLGRKKVEISISGVALYHDVFHSLIATRSGQSGVTFFPDEGVSGDNIRYPMLFFLTRSQYPMVKHNGADHVECSPALRSDVFLVVKQDVTIEKGKVTGFRVRLTISFKYHPSKE